MSRLSGYPVFIAVFEEKRMVNAARRLCVTPSAVSHALRDFESRLGVVLFERTPEGLVPTVKAKALYAKVKPLLSAIEAAERELTTQTEGQGSTEFAFASIHTFIKAFFVPILERLHNAEHPVSVRFLTGSMHSTVEAVASDEALIGSTMLPLPRPERFYVVPLAEIKEYFLISPSKFEELQALREHPQEPWTLEEIVSHPLITLPRDSISFECYSRYFAQYGLSLEPRYEVHQQDLGFDLARRGLGIFIGFEPELFAGGDLKKIPCSSSLPGRELVLFCRKENATPSIKSLMSEIALQFGHLTETRA